MCYSARLDSPASKPLVATEDIKCYKAIQKRKKYWWNKTTYHSYWYPLHKWKLGELYETTITPYEYAYYFEINEGFHSFSSHLMALANQSSCDTIIIHCIIPAGSTYYHNPEDELYVSTKIKFIDFD